MREHSSEQRVIIFSFPASFSHLHDVWLEVFAELLESLCVMEVELDQVLGCATEGQAFDCGMWALSLSLSMTRVCAHFISCDTRGQAPLTFVACGFGLCYDRATQQSWSSMRDQEPGPQCQRVGYRLRPAEQKSSG